MGSGVVARAVVQAYRQALTSACKPMLTSFGVTRLLKSQFIANPKVIFPCSIILSARVMQWLRDFEDASKSGVAQETIQNVSRRASKVMTEQEARQILGVNEQSTWEEILQKYDILFERNAKNGSFYLQSKVHRAKECLESLYQPKDDGTPG